MGKNFCQIGSKWCKFCRRGNCDFSKTPTESLANCPRIEAIKTTNLSTLVNAVDFETVFNSICKWWPNQISNRLGYQDVYNLIKTYTPTEIKNLNDLFIEVDIVEEDDEPWLSVSGVSLSNRYKKFGIEFTPWKDWVSMNVTSETLARLPIEDIVGACLYEMTFFGFSEEDPENNLQRLKNSIDEIKNSK